MTNVSYEAVKPEIQERHKYGSEAGTGFTYVEFAPYGDADITEWIEEGYRAWGVFQGEFNLDPEVDDYIAGGGGDVGVQLGVCKTDQRIPLEFTFTAPTEQAIQDALSNYALSPTYPGTNTTVATGVQAPTYNSARVADSSGFAVGDRVAITTGDATYGTAIEFVKIRTIDTSNHDITFSPPVQQLPENAADFKKVSSIDWQVTSQQHPTPVVLRVTKQMHGNRTMMYHVAEFQILSGAINEADGKNPRTATIRGFVMPEYDSSNDYYIFVKMRELYS